MEDCFFFLYSKCKLGDKCMFRHNVAAKENLVTCKNWKKTKFCKVECPFRHSLYHEVKQRTDIMCYWESKTGCVKYRCEFKHVDPKKDEWKETRVKSLSQIQIDKEMILQASDGQVNNILDASNMQIIDQVDNPTENMDLCNSALYDNNDQVKILNNNNQDIQEDGKVDDLEKEFDDLDKLIDDE